MKQRWLACMVGVMTLVAAMITAGGRPGVANEQEVEPPSAEAVARARKQVKMLDHIYKTAIVLITDKYVHDEEDFAAGAAAVAWFEQISSQGSHQVRLIDVTGEPYDADNVARDAFEKAAVTQLKEGKAYYDQVQDDEEGKPVLRAMTAVPVVMQKCVMCHPHYADAAKGAAIGAVSYAIPIE